MFKRLLSTLALCILLTACQTSNRFSDTGAGLFTWDNDISAAVVLPTNDKHNPNPRSCMQMAMAFGGLNASGSAKISDALLNISKSAEKTTNAQARQDLVDISANITKTAKAFQTSTERTAFLQIGAFYICQLQANGLEDKKINNLMSSLIIASSRLDNSAQSKEINAQAIADFRTEVESALGNSNTDP